MNKQNVKLSVITALFTALTAVCTAYISVPIPGGAGYVHFGDALIMLSACILPFPYALFVGAIGGAFADIILAFPVYVPYTIIIKLLIALCYSSKKDNILCVRNILGFIPTAIFTIGGYYLADVIIYSNWVSTLASIPANTIQVVGSAVIFCIFAFVLDKIKFKNNIAKLINK